MTPWRGLIEEYADFLPSVRSQHHIPAVTLFEGNTPLIPAPILSERVGARVMLKVEGHNPTGSFKDRGMTVAVTHALAGGADAVVCASTGNTSASAAAYAVRAGLRCVVLIPDGKITLAKLSQALMYGAEVIQIDGNFDDALDIVRKLGADGSIAVVNSVNPERIEGQKTGAFEIIDALGDAPDYQCMPVGNAGNITAYWKGYNEYRSVGRSTRLPVMLGFQAAGAAPFVAGHPIAKPETIATAIRIGNPASWTGAVDAVTDSKGSFTAVTDDEIVEAYKFVAANEGIFCEPASAASIAGLLKSNILEASTVVCVLTGNGLKDSELAIASSPIPVKLAANESAIRNHLNH